MSQETSNIVLKVKLCSGTLTWIKDDIIKEMKQALRQETQRKNKFYDSIYLPKLSATRVRWHKVNFLKQSLTDLNSVSCIKSGCHTKFKEPSLPYYLSI